MLLLSGPRSEKSGLEVLQLLTTLTVVSHSRYRTRTTPSFAFSIQTQEPAHQGQKGQQGSRKGDRRHVQKVICPFYSKRRSRRYTPKNIPSHRSASPAPLRKVGCRAFFSKSAGTSRLTAHRMPAVTGGADVKVDEQQVLISVKTKIVKPEPDPRPHYPSRVTSELSALVFTTTRAPQSQK